MDDLLTDFLTETTESLAELDVALVKLERTPDDAGTLSLIFRMVHTIKGTCGFLGLPRLERVAHAGENVLGKVRDGVLVVTPDVISEVLRALDRIKLIVAGLAATEAELQGDDSELIAALDLVAAGKAASPPTPAPAAPVTVNVPAVAVAVHADEVTAAPQGGPNPAVPHDDAPAARVATALTTTVRAAAVAPAPTTTAPAAGTAATHPDPALTDPTQSDKVAGQQTIRVTVDVLEDLMTLVSELVLTRNQLLQLARVQDNATFAVPLQRLSHITTDLQKA
jgi:two-component system chemotaxis sensor kinase CheA